MLLLSKMYYPGGLRDGGDVLGSAHFTLDEKDINRLQCCMMHDG